jgi:transposase
MAKLQIITVKESVAELTKLIGNSSPGIKPRLKMLMAIVNGITSTSELTSKTKSNRESIRQWKNIYAQNGIDGLLKEHRGGKRYGSINDKQKRELEKKLSDPKGGFTTYKQAAAWINKSFGLEMNYHAVNMYLKRNFGTKLKVGRKTHINKDDSAAALFKKTIPGAKTY